MTKSQVSCSKICHANLNCLSYNFCGDRVCHLLTDDVYSSTEIYLIEDAACIHASMKVGSIAESSDTDGAVKAVNSSQYCKINMKGKPAEWSNWEPRLEDTPTFWKKFEARFCILGYHVIDNSCSGQNEKVEEHFLWSETEHTFWDAADHCNRQGGQLYGSDVTQEKLEFVYTHLGGGSI